MLIDIRSIYELTTGIRSKCGGEDWNTQTLTHMSNAAFDWLLGSLLCSQNADDCVAYANTTVVKCARQQRPTRHDRAAVAIQSNHPHRQIGFATRVL